MFLFSSEIKYKEINHNNKKTKLILSILIPIISVIVLSIIGYLFISPRNNNEETNFQWNQREELSSIINDIIKQYKVIGWEMSSIPNIGSELDMSCEKQPIRNEKNNAKYKSENNPEYIKEKDIIDEKVKSAIEKKPLEEVEEYESYIEELVLRINHNLRKMENEGCNINEMVKAIKEFYCFIRDIWSEISFWSELKIDSSMIKILSHNTEGVKCFNYIGKNITIPFLLTTKDANNIQNLLKELKASSSTSNKKYVDEIDFEMLLLVENYFQAFLLESEIKEEINIGEKIKELKILKLIIKERRKQGLNDIIIYFRNY